MRAPNEVWYSTTDNPDYYWAGSIDLAHGEIRWYEFQRGYYSGPTLLRIWYGTFISNMSGRGAP